MLLFLNISLYEKFIKKVLWIFVWLSILLTLFSIVRFFELGIAGRTTSFGYNSPCRIPVFLMLKDIGIFISGSVVFEFLNEANIYMKNIKIIIALFFFSILLYILILFYFLSLIDIQGILILIIVIFGIWPIIHSFITGSRDSLSPKVLLPFTYTLYALGPLSLSADFSQDVVIHYLFLQLVGMLSLHFGLYFGIKNLDIHTTTRLNINKSKKVYLLITILGLIVLSVPSLLTQFSAFGGFSNLISVGYGGKRYQVLSSSFMFGTGFEWLLLGSIIMIFYGLKYNSRKCLYGGTFLYLAIAYILLLIGGRSTLVYTVLFGTILIHYGYRKIPSRFIILGMVVGIVFAQYYSLARYFLPNGLWYAISQTWNIVVQNPSLLLPLSVNEFVQPGASLLEILQNGDIRFVFGRSYISTIGAPIPFISRLFAQAGFDPSLWRLQTFHSDILASGGGLGFSPVSEGYINFGILGIIVNLFIYGYIPGMVYKRFLSKKGVGSLLFFAGTLPIFMLDGMRIHSASFVYKWTRSYLMPWLIFVVIYNCLNREQISQVAKEVKDHE